MPGAQTRSQRSKATSKLPPRGATSARKPSKGNSEDRAGAVASISAEERQKLIARAAYFRAEKRGFSPGCELQDWVEAEAEVLRLIGAG
jgi:hypothetical protein